MSSYPVFNCDSVRDPESRLKAKSLFSMHVSQSDQGPRYEVQVEQSTVSILEQTFNPKADMVILVVSGLAGVGKSTWLNTLAFSLDPELRSDPFQAGEAQLGITKGMTVYPKPLMLNNILNTQILLCDMEGVDGLRDDIPAKENKELLKRLLLCGLMLSSHFCVHSLVRLQSSQLQSLNDIYQMAQELQGKFGLDPPQISLVMAETNLVQNVPRIKTEIRTHCNVSKDLCDALKIEARGQPSTRFLESRKTQDLLGSVYHECALRLLYDSTTCPKGRPGLNTPFRLSDFSSLLNTLREAINTEDFGKKYLNSIQHSVKELISPKLDQHSLSFEQKVTQAVHDISSFRSSSEGLNLSLQKMKQQTEAALVDDIEKELNAKIATRPDLKRVVQIFHDRLELIVQRATQTASEQIPGSIRGEKPAADSALGREEASKSSLHQGKDSPSSPDDFHRFSSFENQGILASSSSTQIFPPPSDLPCPGPLKKDGTPDMRYKANREAGLCPQMKKAGTIPVSDNHEYAKIFMAERTFPGPAKLDGTPDMRYSVNKELMEKKRPLKKDGTPDMRYSVNRQTTTRQQTEELRKGEEEGFCRPRK